MNIDPRRQPPSAAAIAAERQRRQAAIRKAPIVRGLAIVGAAICLVSPVLIYALAPFPQAKAVAVAGLVVAALVLQISQSMTSNLPSVDELDPIPLREDEFLRAVLRVKDLQLLRYMNAAAAAGRRLTRVEAAALHNCPWPARHNASPTDRGPSATPAAAQLVDPAPRAEPITRAGAL